MKDKTLLGISLTISLFGLVFLFFTMLLSDNPSSMSNSNYNFGNTERYSDNIIRGKIVGISQKNTSIILKIEHSCESKILINKNQNMAKASENKDDKKNILDLLEINKTIIVNVLPIDEKTRFYAAEKITAICSNNITNNGC